jgi:poly(U)-specific endoribonuclease
MPKCRVCKVDRGKNRFSGAERKKPSPICKLCDRAEEKQAAEAAIVPTQEELSSLSLGCSKLWDLDVDRLRPGVDYELDLQRGKSSYQAGDFAGRPLFKFVNEEVLNLG